MNEYIYGKYSDYYATIIAKCPECGAKLEINEEEFNIDYKDETVVWVEGRCPKCGRRYKVTTRREK